MPTRTPGGAVTRGRDARSLRLELETELQSYLVVATSTDGILVPIECKVSNSALNSHKRLIHEAGHKAHVCSGGIPDCVPAVVVAGVFSLDNLARAQDEGLAIFWKHRLNDLVDDLKPDAEVSPR